MFIAENLEWTSGRERAESRNRSESRTIISNSETLGMVMFTDFKEEDFKAMQTQRCSM